jgi:hypothetical protein
MAPPANRDGSGLKIKWRQTAPPALNHEAPDLGGLDFPANLK